MSIQRCNDQHDYSPVHRVTDVFGKIRFGIVSETAYLANHKQREASANPPVTISLEKLTNCLVSVQNIAYEFYTKNRGKWRSITITYGIFWWPSKYDKHTEGSINSTTDVMRLLIAMIFSKQKRILFKCERREINRNKNIHISFGGTGLVIWTFILY